MLSYLSEKNLDAWLGGYARHLAANIVKPSVEGPRHLLFAICDHYEPLFDTSTTAIGDARVRAWEEGYPAIHGRFRDADGRPPRHSFFFPGEQYLPRWMDVLAKLTKDDLGEVELHEAHHALTVGVDEIKGLGDVIVEVAVVGLVVLSHERALRA